MHCEDESLHGEGLPDGEVAGDEGEAGGCQERRHVGDGAEEAGLESLGLSIPLGDTTDGAIAGHCKGEAPAVVAAQDTEGLEIEHDGSVFGQAADEDGGRLGGECWWFWDGVNAAVRDGEARGIIPAADEVAHADGVADALADEASPAYGLLRNGVTLIAVEGGEDRPAGGQTAGGEIEVEEAVGIVAVNEVGGSDVRPGGAPGGEPAGAREAMDSKGAEVVLRWFVGVSEYGDLMSPCAEAP